MIKKCKCHGKRACTWCFFTTIGFPVEHVLWEKAPLLSGITKLLGV